MNKQGNTMEKVEMIVSGQFALVDTDMAKKIAKKQQLVFDAMAIKYTKDLSDADKAAKTSEIASKIIRLNRTIRQGCVQFL
jgi:hypothetical protein